MHSKHQDTLTARRREDVSANKWNRKGKINNNKNKTKTWFSEINEIDKPLGRLPMKKREKPQITNIGIETGYITTYRRKNKYFSI